MKYFCPISRSEFKEKAEPIELQIEGVKVEARPREFSTGSFGWNYSGRMNINVGGRDLEVRISCNFTVLGSKER